MGNWTYLIATILIIIWAVGFFGGYYTGGIIHMLLLLAAIAILVQMLSRPE